MPAKSISSSPRGMTDSDPVAIRPALNADLPHLAAIEVDAARRFADAGVTLPGGDEAIPPGRYDRIFVNGVLLVAETETSLKVGFAASAPLGDSLFLCEMSVLRDWQGRGVGSRLLAATEAAARSRRLSIVSLTTDRHLAWNGPFYARRGYRILDAPELPADLAGILEQEAAAGFDPARRVAMVKPV